MPGHGEDAIGLDQKLERTGKPELMHVRSPAVRMRSERDRRSLPGSALSAHDQQNTMRQIVINNGGLESASALKAFL